VLQRIATATHWAELEPANKNEVQLLLERARPMHGYNTPHVKRRKGKGKWKKHEGRTGSPHPRIPPTAGSTMAAPVERADAQAEPMPNGWQSVMDTHTWKLGPPNEEEVGGALVRRRGSALGVHDAPSKITNRKNTPPPSLYILYLSLPLSPKYPTICQLQYEPHHLPSCPDEKRPKRLASALHRLCTQ
jgi:hypothetical protein